LIRVCVYLIVDYTTGKRCTTKTAYQKKRWYQQKRKERWKEKSKKRRTPPGGTTACPTCPVSK